MRLIAFVCLFPIAVSAQAQVASDALCSIEGRVVNALTGEPLKKAGLFLLSSEPPPRDTPQTLYSTVSGPDGHFAMTNLPPGPYWLSVDRSGFTRAGYGARTPGQRGAMIHLSRGQTLTDVDFRLTPQGIVLGRVVDEDGEPVINAQVQLLRLHYAQGKRQLGEAHRWPPIGTNDLGEYRVFGLDPEVVGRRFRETRQDRFLGHRDRP